MSEVILYVRINDPRLSLEDEFILFKADASLPPFKIGHFNPHGWLAYWVDGVLFRKTFDARTDAAYPDGNCNAEMYCNDRFVELESLGPLTKLNPGTEVAPTETWDVFQKTDTFPDEIRKSLAIL